jgi:hypothetical protein
MGDRCRARRQHPRGGGDANDRRDRSVAGNGAPCSSTQALTRSEIEIQPKGDRPREAERIPRPSQRPRTSDQNAPVTEKPKRLQATSKRPKSEAFVSFSQTSISYKGSFEFLAQPPGLSLPLEQAQNVTLADGALDVADNGPSGRPSALGVHELDPDLRDVPGVPGPSQHAIDLGKLDGLILREEEDGTRGLVSAVSGKAGTMSHDPHLIDAKEVGSGTNALMNRQIHIRVTSKQGPVARPQRRSATKTGKAYHGESLVQKSYCGSLMWVWRGGENDGKTTIQNSIPLTLQVFFLLRHWLAASCGRRHN